MRPTILVVEDNEITRKLVRVTLVGEGYAVLEAPDGRTAVELTRTGHPDLILQDLLLPDVDGFDLLNQLRALPEGAAIPIVAFSGFLSRLESARALSRGFTDFLPKPLEPSRLVQSIAAYLPAAVAANEQRGRGQCILVADDDPVGLKLTTTHLERLAFEVVTARDGAEALRLARHSPPDAILSDILMPKMDGFQLCLAVREDPGLKHLPVVLCSANYIEDWDRRLAERVGASATITRDPNMEEAVEAVIDCLDRSMAPPPQGEPDMLEAERLYRVVRQLERQVSANAGLVQRVSLQAAILSLVAGLPDSVARSSDIAAAPGAALAGILEAGGVSMGAIYLIETNGSLKLENQSGFAEDDAVASMFGHPELFAMVARDGPGVAIPSSAVPEETGRDILARAGVRSVVVMPLSSRMERLGVLLLASQRRDLTHQDWLAFARSISSQLAQTIALGRAFARLSASEGRYRNLFDSTPIGLFRTTVEGAFIEANEALRSVLGCPDQEILFGLRLDHFYVDLEDYRALQASVDRDGITAGVEARLRRHDGRSIRGRVTLRALNGPDESGYAGSVEDVTDQRSVEADLRESSTTLRTLIDASPVAITSLDLTGRVIVWNPAAERMFGWSDREAVGQLLATVPDDNRPEFEAALARNRRGEASVYETQRKRKDGSLVNVLSSTSAILDGEGRVAATMAILVDVTEQKRLEEQLRQAMKMEGIGRLAGGIAHDFNNLLTVIAGRVYLLLGQLAADHPMRRDLQLIGQTGERAAALTKQLLAFSRKQVLTPIVLDFNGVVDTMKQLLGRVLGEDVHLIIDLDSSLDRVLADQGQLEQVILNLAVNARDAMPDGGQLVLTTTNVDVDDAYARRHPDLNVGTYASLAVSDTGTGMAPETMARIFEPFFTTKEVGRGTGLGLATVYGIVKQSNGHVTVESERGRGTTFRVYLPRVKGEAAALAAAAETGIPAGTETVLLVEDDPDLRGLACDLLQGQGYAVLEGAEPEAAIRIAGEHPGRIDLVITDVVMPKMNGRAMARVIQERRPEAKVLYMSGYTDDAIVRHGVLEPGIDFLQKPFTPSALARKVREVIDRGAHGRSDAQSQDPDR
jgi:PAS domain S-box-containing protein